MKKIVLAVILLLSTAVVYAEQYENPMIDMTAPSGLEEKQAYFTIGHKFLQSLANYPGDDLFALINYRANIYLGFRYMVWQGIEAKAGYISLRREKIAGLSYVLKTPDIGFNTQLDAQYVNYQDYNTGAPVVQNFFYLLSVQSVAVFDDRFYFTLNAGYDGIEKNFGLGLGISAEIMRHVRLLAEYYPVLNPVRGNTTGCYALGLKIDTYGHQFILRLGNSPEIGTRDLMLGTKTQDLYAGFEIMRLIAF